jgi:hypothetical protein
MGIAMNQGRLQDDELVLHDGTAAVTADALATVGGQAADGIVDLGEADCAFDVVFDVTAIDVASNDEAYELQILGSDSSSFASGISLLGVLQLGALETLVGGTGGVDVDSTTGRYILTCRNRQHSTVYRYVRLNFEVAGTTPSITVPNVAITKITAA